MNYSVHLSSDIYRHASVHMCVCVCEKSIFLLDGPVLEVKCRIGF